MEFVAFVLCMTIIAQINAAPTPESGLNVNIPHHDNEFELPAVARGGFEMNIDITVDEKYYDKLDKMRVLLLPNEHEDPNIVSKYCRDDNNVTQHTHICVVPDELQKRNGQQNQTAIQRVRILATLNHEEDGLQMMAFLNQSYSSEMSLPLKQFEEMKHFSVEGVAGDIKRLLFDFDNKR